MPSIVVFLTVMYMVKKYFNDEQDKRQNEIRLKNLNTTTPLRLQAYERFVLFLERISVENLLVRVNKPGFTCGQLHTELLTSIRAEFEHNLSQQIYISNKAWEMIKSARSNVVHLVNSNAEKMSPESPSINLSKAILEETMRNEKLPTAEAILILKEELNSVI